MKTKNKTKTKKNTKSALRVTHDGRHQSCTFSSQVPMIHSRHSASRVKNICTIFSKKIHIACAHSVTWKQFTPRPAAGTNWGGFALRSVKPLVPLLPLLEDDGSDHGAHHDPQQRAQQQQEHLPAGQRRAAEVSGRVVDVVCGRGRKKIHLMPIFTDQ